MYRTTRGAASLLMLVVANCGGSGAGADAHDAAGSDVGPSDGRDVGAPGSDAGPDTTAQDAGDDGDAAGLDGTSDSGGGGCVASRTLSAVESAAYFPYSVGAQWSFRASLIANAQSTTKSPFFDTLEVTGTMAIGGLTGTVVRESRPLTSPTPADTYLEVVPSGLVNLGSNQPGAGPPPYVAVPFPVTVCSTFVSFPAVDVTDVDYDGDGIPDRLVTEETTTLQLETVTVPVGTFTDALKVQRIRRFTRYYSSARAPLLFSQTTIDWYGAGTGPVRRSIITSDGEQASLELVGYSAGSAAGGIVPQGTLALGLPEDSGNPYARMPVSIAYDGQQFLVVTPTSTPPSNGNLQAIFVGADGKPGTSVTLLDSSSQITSAVVAFDGVRYLVAYYNPGYSRVEGVVLSRQGAVLDGPLVLSNTLGLSNELNGAPQVLGVPGGGGFLLSFGKYYSGTGTSSLAMSQLWFTPVSSTGHPTAYTQPFSNAAGGALASDGTNALALWGTIAAGGSTSTTGFVAARLKLDGTPIDATPFPVVDATDGSVAGYNMIFDGTDYVLLWTVTKNDIETSWVARIGTDGTLRDGPATQPGLDVVTPTGRTAPLSLGRVGSGTLLLWPLYCCAPEIGQSIGIMGARFTGDGMLPDVTAQDHGVWMVGPGPHATLGDPMFPVLGYGGARSLLVWRAQTDFNADTFDLDYALVYPW